MERKTFTLLKLKTFRHNLKLFIRDSEGNVSKRTCDFKTEHLVNKKDRTKKARRVNAEYSTNNEKVYDAMLRDPGYGKTFILKGDTELKMKKSPIDITPMDAKKLALRNLFGSFGLEFDSSKSNAVLQEELNCHHEALGGKKAETVAPVIPHEPINIASSIEDQVAEGIKAYEEKTGEEFPDFVKHSDVINFLDGQQNPDFNSKVFLANSEIQEKEESSDDLPNTAEEMQEVYFATFKKGVAIPMKNNVAWMQDKVREELTK